MCKIKNLVIFALITVLFTSCSNTNTSHIKSSSNSAVPSLAVSSKAKTSNESSSTSTENLNESNASSTISNNKKGFIFPNSDKQLINDEELNNYDKFTLLLAKNEIFARRGYKFKDQTLLDYFNNTGWYKISNSVNGDYNDLNDIEKKNFDLINQKYNNISKIYMEKNQYQEIIKKDINFDGKDETLTATFTKDNEFAKYEIEVDSDGKSYKINGDCGVNITPNLYFADFCFNDNYINFYINYTIEDDYHCTTIFQFNKDGIKKLFDLQGYLESYDGNKKIYSELSKTTDKNKIPISYYELGKGVAYPPKNSIVGNYLEYEKKLLIFNDINDKNSGNTSFMSLLGNDDDNWKNYYKEGQVVTITKPNEKLKILDIDYKAYNYTNNSDPIVRNIPIKVQTEDGKQGWLVWINGGV